MTDLAKLRELAEAADVAAPSVADEEAFTDAASPWTVIALLDRIAALEAAQTQPPFCREMWLALVAACQVANEPDLQKAALNKIERLRENAPSRWKERADEYHGQVIKLTDRLASTQAALDEACDVATAALGQLEPFAVLDEGMQSNLETAYARIDAISQLRTAGRVK